MDKDCEPDLVCPPETIPVLEEMMPLEQMREPHRLGSCTESLFRTMNKLQGVLPSSPKT